MGEANSNLINIPTIKKEKKRMRSVMDEDRCLSYGKQKEGMVQSMTVLFLNVHILYDYCFFFFYTIKICTVFSQLWVMKINLGSLDH